MWSLLAAVSAIMLGLYDVAKKKALARNGVLTVLLLATGLSTIFVSPFLRGGELIDFLRLGLKALLVTASWISGLLALKLLPLTTVSIFKGSRPVFVVLLSVLIFGEQLSWVQWTGVVTVLSALFMLGYTSKGDAPAEARREGFIYMGIAVLTGVASALYDKHIIAGLEPMFVQSWTNLFITVLMALCLLWSSIRARRNPGAESFSSIRWDWWVVVVAVLITGADACYFFALKQPGALLSVISLVRRGSILVTFAVGAWIFHEKRVAAKTFNLLLLFAGVLLLLIGS